MKILLLGSNGPVGRRILAEAITRGHEVTAFVRPESRAAWTVKPGILPGKSFI
jgi:putative NADH-flavin reductase